MEGTTATPMPMPQHRRPDPPHTPRIVRWAAIAGMVLVIAAILWAAVPLWSWAPTGGIPLTGSVGVPRNPQPPTTITTTQTVPVVVYPPTAPVRHDGITQDCPLQGLTYTCGGK